MYFKCFPLTCRLTATHYQLRANHSFLRSRETTNTNCIAFGLTEDQTLAIPSVRYSEGLILRRVMWVWLASSVRYSEGLILRRVMWVWLASPVRYSEGLILRRGEDQTLAIPHWGS
jgi:hypothetical protein